MARPHHGGFSQHTLGEGHLFPRSAEAQVLALVAATLLRGGAAMPLQPVI